MYQVHIEKCTKSMEFQSRNCKWHSTRLLRLYQLENIPQQSGGPTASVHTGIKHVEAMEL